MLDLAARFLADVPPLSWMSGLAPASIRAAQTPSCDDSTARKRAVLPSRSRRSMEAPSLIRVLAHSTLLPCAVPIRAVLPLSSWAFTLAPAFNNSRRQSSLLRLEAYIRAVDLGYGWVPSAEAPARSNCDTISTLPSAADEIRAVAPSSSCVSRLAPRRMISATISS